MTKVVVLQLGIDKVARHYGRQKNRIPRRDWTSIACVAVAGGIVILGLLKASVEGYRSLMGTGLPPHVSSILPLR